MKTLCSCLWYGDLPKSRVCPQCQTMNRVKPDHIVVMQKIAGGVSPPLNPPMRIRMVELKMIRVVSAVRPPVQEWRKHRKPPPLRFELTENGQTALAITKTAWWLTHG